MAPHAEYSVTKNLLLHVLTGCSIPLVQPDWISPNLSIARNLSLQ